MPMLSCRSARRNSSATRNSAAALLVAIFTNHIGSFARRKWPSPAITVNEGKCLESNRLTVCFAPRRRVPMYKVKTIRHRPRRLESLLLFGVVHRQVERAAARPCATAPPHSKQYALGFRLITQRHGILRAFDRGTIDFENQVTRP